MTPGTSIPASGISRRRFGRQVAGCADLRKCSSFLLPPSSASSPRCCRAAFLSAVRQCRVAAARPYFFVGDDEIPPGRVRLLFAGCLWSVEWKCRPSVPALSLVCRCETAPARVDLPLSLGSPRTAPQKPEIAITRKLRDAFQQTAQRSSALVRRSSRPDRSCPRRCRCDDRSQLREDGREGRCCPLHPLCRHRRTSLRRYSGPDHSDGCLGSVQTG